MPNLGFDSLYHPHPSRRMTVYANRGMVCTSQPLAAQAGLDVLRRGGNAIDAAVATAAALTVVEPTSNGIGSDAFALIWTGGKLYGLNSSGPAPMGISAERLRDMGHTEMPRFGWAPVNVSGAPAAWAAASERFGRLPFTKLFESAVDYAERGYPLSPILAKYWGSAMRAYQTYLDGPEFEHFFQTFFPSGSAPRAGEVWSSPGHAKTLQAIAESKARAFYEGSVAEAIDRFSQETGGYLRISDLARFQPEWVDPVHVNYRGYEVWEIPPNGQGIVALMALNILKGFDFTEQGSTLTLHRQIEAIKLAFADGKKYITERSAMPVSVEDLLSDAYADERRKLIGDSAGLPHPGKPPGGGTVYLATADGEGNMVSWIQSNYLGFGSGLVVPGTGISLQNRGSNFSLDENHANVLAPGKRTYHTIIPGFLTKGGQPVGPFGVMGGFMQPQGHVQVVMNTVDFGLNPQAALDTPRWQWMEDKTVEVEPSLGQHIVQALMARGHRMVIANDSGGFGRGEIIWRDDAGVLAGGTEPRTDGQVAAW